MNVIAVYGVCATALVGLGLYGLIVNAQPLRKILLDQSAWHRRVPAVRGYRPAWSCAGLGGDPVPQAMIITQSWSHSRRRR